MASIGENIKVLRLARGWTQEELAQRLHLTRQAVGHYESGRTVPDIDTCRRLAEVFGVELEVLLEGEGEPVKMPKWLWGLTTAALVVPLLIHSLLLMATLLYIVPEGQVSAEMRPILQKRVGLLNAAETVESVSYFLFLIVLVVLVLWMIRQRQALPWKEQGRFLLALTLLSLLATLPFALADPTRGAWNYVFPQFLNIRRLIIALLLAWIARKVQKR